MAALAFAERLETMSSFSLSVRYGEWSASIPTIGNLPFGVMMQGRNIASSLLLH